MGEEGDKKIAEADDEVNAATWMKIGEHSNRDTLKQTAKKIRSKWAGRYDFQICPCSDKKGFELRLRHR